MHQLTCTPGVPTIPAARGHLLAVDNGTLRAHVVGLVLRLFPSAFEGMGCAVGLACAPSCCVLSRPDVQECTIPTAMSQTELVAMLRSKARKSGTQTSHYRGVSLLKQTGKWHAQINVGGKQVHLGFFPTEDLAACAYDRAAINKGARDGGKIITNFDITNYMSELEYLRRIPQEQLVAALSSEG